MVSEDGRPSAAFTTEYKAIVARAQAAVAGFPPLLQGLAGALLPELSEGEFSRIVALLPYWVAEMLDGPESAPSAEAHTLGLASLLGWWSYLIQDGLLDRDLGRAGFLPLAMALHATAVRLLAQLLPSDSEFWEAFQRLSLTAAEAYCWEQHHHLLPLSEPDGKAFDLDDLGRLADRSALLQVPVVAQFALRGRRPTDRRCVALAQMLRHYATARQIADDCTDWVRDLKKDRLNYVSARVARRMVERGAAESYTELDADWMAGYFLYDDDLFADIQQVALTACQRAAQSMEGYDSVYLGELVSELAGRLEQSYAAELDSRRKLKVLFPPLSRVRSGI
jgi:hypothetical protein